MVHTITPKTKAIRSRINAAIQEGKFSCLDNVARTILKRWHKEHYSSETSWIHGSGKKTNGHPPNPEQANVSSCLSRYINGTTAQNVEGWKMVAELLDVGLEDIVEWPSVVSGRELGQNGTRGIAMASGPLPLSKLANVDVYRPWPSEGGNRVHLDSERQQAIALSARAMFNTIRNEEFCSDDGALVAEADIELTYAYLVVRVADPSVEILAGIGMDGRMELGKTQISYIGTQDDLVFFEIAPSVEGESLAGIAQLMDNFVELKGRFDRADFIGAAFEGNGIRLAKLHFPEPVVGEKSIKTRPIGQSIKKQILARAIALSSCSNPSDEKMLTVKRFFMETIVDDPES